MEQKRLGCSGVQVLGFAAIVAEAGRMYGMSHLVQGFGIEDAGCGV